MPFQLNLKRTISTAGVTSVVSPQGWKAEVISAVEHWLTLIPQLSGQPRWKLIGKAHCGDEPGWLVLDRRGDPVKLDTLNDLCFAGDGGPDVAIVYPIEVFRQVDGLLLLQEPPALPERSRMVWTKSMSVRVLTEKLLSGLRESTDVPIADAFAAGRLAKGPVEEAGDPSGLIGAQVDAYRACLSPGVRLVWGPPGAGKTMVLARAIEYLINEDKRVLLVSTANIAVDNALHAVVKAMQLPRGTAVRVGPPHLADVVNNTHVHLGKLAAAASADVDHQLHEIRCRLAELDDIDAETARLSEQVGDFSPANYQLALQRIKNERKSEALAQQILCTEKRWEEFERHATAKRATLQCAQNEWNRIVGPRDALRKANELRDQLDSLKRDLKSKQEAVTAAELQLTEARGWLATRKARKIHERAIKELRPVEECARERQPQLSKRINEHRANAEPTTPDDVTNVETELRKARSAADEAEQAEATAQSELHKLRDQYHAVQNRGLPTEADHKLVHRSQSTDLHTKHKELEHLRGQQRGVATQRGKLEGLHRELVDRARKLRQDMETHLIEKASLVATTLAQSRLRPALAAARFDIVLVDEAGAAPLAEVLLALCRATKSAVLFGDFLQLSPVQDKMMRDSTHEHFRKWVLPNPFTHVSIRTPTDARRHPGCVTLLHQFRFGSNLRRLANDVIYEVLRDATELPGVAARPDTEIVLVDTASVGELAQIRRPEGRRSSAWWPAGLVLSRALAEYHLSEGSEVGIVTPYKFQQDATLAGLRDRGLVTGVSVGTVHAFQGREFSTVIFDLVEDGGGWVARARRNAGIGADEGVRLFGVGITRAQHRLYLIADLGAVKAAAHGPLAALAEAGRRKQIRLWSAATLLGMEDARPQFLDGAFTEVSETLRQLVTVTDITDEKTFYVELERRLYAAASQVWMWSPWISKRARQVIPLIRDTVARGVDVRVFIRPDEDRNMDKPWAQQELPALRDSGATIIRSDHEHRKIVVIDKRIVLFGSLNALSNSPISNTRESMLTLEGGGFASRLLEELQVRILGTIYPCACGKPCEIRRATGRSIGWSWYCAPCKKHVPVPVPSRSS